MDEDYQSYLDKVAELKRQHDIEKRKLDVEFMRASKTSWIERLMEYPTILKIRIDVEYREDALVIKEGEHYSGKETSMEFTIDELDVLVPLLNAKALNIYELNKLGTEEKP